VSCKYHLFLDVSSRTGAIKLNYPDREVWELEESCALDIAERGGATLVDVGNTLNLTRERVRQIEIKALAKVEYMATLADAGSTSVDQAKQSSNPNRVIQELPQDGQRLVHVEFIGIDELLATQLRADPTLIHSLTPAQFELLVCDRLSAMGFEPRQVGHTNRSDGGIDVVFWPRSPAALPFLGAVQVKHHRNSRTREGSPTVRDFAGAISGHPFSAGILVTNTGFTPDAEWFARERTNLIRLRGFTDIRRWLQNNFTDPQEWREIPPELALAPGVTIKIR
jgi:restriction endonuclease Mrr